MQVCYAPLSRMKAWEMPQDVFIHFWSGNLFATLLILLDILRMRDTLPDSHDLYQIIHSHLLRELPITFINGHADFYSSVSFQTSGSGWRTLSF